MFVSGTEFMYGLSGSSLDGKTVEVKSVGVVNSTGTSYRATEIKIDD